MPQSASVRDALGRPHCRPPIGHHCFSAVSQARVPPRISKLTIRQAFGSTLRGLGHFPSFSAGDPEPRHDRRLWDPCHTPVRSWTGDLPAPDASDDLVKHLDASAFAAEDWYSISAALLERERSTGDVQAGWLMTAFDYGLARRVGENRKQKEAFGEKFSTGGSTYPTPLEHVPVEVVSLWSSAAERVTAPAARARLYHLLFERRRGQPWRPRSTRRKRVPGSRERHLVTPGPGELPSLGRRRLQAGR